MGASFSNNVKGLHFEFQNGRLLTADLRQTDLYNMSASTHSAPSSSKSILFIYLSPYNLTLHRFLVMYLLKN